MQDATTKILSAVVVGFIVVGFGVAIISAITAGVAYFNYLLL